MAAIAKELGVTIEYLLMSVARGEDPPYAAWRPFIDQHGADLTAEERDALAMINWPREPSLTSYILAKQALRT